MVESTKRVQPSPDSHDGETYLSRYLKIDKIDFPVQNPINFTMTVDNREVKIHTVEYPNEGELKGIIFVFVGYGAYVDFYGGYFKDLAKAGYRMFGMDRHGFGKSEGVRGDVGPNIIETQFRFVDKIVETFNLQNEKKFIFGISLGGLIGLRMMELRPDYFSGAMLNVPWFANSEEIKIGFVKRLALKAMSALFRARILNLPSKGEEFDEFLN